MSQGIKKEILKKGNISFEKRIGVETKDSKVP